MEQPARSDKVPLRGWSRSVVASAITATEGLSVTSAKGCRASRQRLDGSSSAAVSCLHLSSRRSSACDGRRVGRSRRRRPSR